MGKAKHQRTENFKKVNYIIPTLLLVLVVGCNQQKRSADLKAHLTVSSLTALVQMPSDELKQLDIAQMNLLCAKGLLGAEHLDVTGSLAAIDQIATRARLETERHVYRFQRNPAEYENSEGFFRMMMLMVVIAEDFHVQYAPNKMVNSANAKMGDGFFADSQDVFLHGLTGVKHQGTCSSLPVLYVAVGRRLGYPLKLVTTKGHLFVRWEDAKERFNFEAAGNGANRFSDDYYRHWPMEVSEAEIQADGHLKSLTPAEELAVFLSIRGMCQAEAGHYTDAVESFGQAAKFAPECKSYEAMRSRMNEFR